jgi:hypothetical protein
VSFRRNYGGDRYLFRVQAIYPKGLTKDKAFAGFQVEGGVDMDGALPVRVKYGAWEVIWNDFEFSRWV